MRKTTAYLQKLPLIKNELRYLDQRYLPRWIVFLIDLLISIVSVVIVFVVLWESPLVFYPHLPIAYQGIFFVGISVLFFIVFKTFRGVVRHSTFTDIIRLAMASITVSVVLLTLNYGYQVLGGTKLFLSTSILLYALLNFALLLSFRVAVKETYHFLKKMDLDIDKTNIAIFGVDDSSIALGKALTQEVKSPFSLKGFVSKNSKSKVLKVQGKPVIPIQDNLEEVFNRLDVEGVLLISEAFTAAEKNEIVDQCLALGKRIFHVPALEEWNRKEDINNQIKTFEIEDLLNRKGIAIENPEIRSDLEGKTIMVTGGAGSIGSEIVKQVAAFNPKLVVIIDQAESALHELELSLTLNYPTLNFTTELANISNMYRLRLLFGKYEVDYVYHAAAYKHVPLIERNPHEAIYVNVLGTVNLAILSVTYEIEKFVMVSTDKAVNPTNVMGASKRVAEMYVQSLQEQRDVNTIFVTTRFGNVLGSNGSVIPHFRKQIAQGGPVTVTHKDIIRYFMTIPEACQLVLQAGTMGKGGEIYVFNMGAPVKILDLAKKMILLSGYEPYTDIDIKITGLRPGEKLYEELLTDASETLPTYHKDIMIAKVFPGDFEQIKVKTKALIKAATRRRDEKVVALLKALVPEYKSENSKFAALDTEDEQIPQVEKR